MSFTACGSGGDNVGDGDVLEGDDEDGLVGGVPELLESSVGVGDGEDELVGGTVEGLLVVSRNFKR